MPKQHVNWSISGEALELLSRVAKTAPRAPGQPEPKPSQLVEQAIFHTYQDPLLSLKERARSLQQQLMVTVDRISVIEQEREKEATARQYQTYKRDGIIKEQDFSSELEVLHGR